MSVTKDEIAGWRGGYPERCDFCGWPVPSPRLLEPEEAGAWVCWHCMWRWKTEDIANGLRDTLGWAEVKE